MGLPCQIRCGWSGQNSCSTRWIWKTHPTTLTSGCSDRPRARLYRPRCLSSNTWLPQNARRTRTDVSTSVRASHRDQHLLSKGRRNLQIGSHESLAEAVPEHPCTIRQPTVDCRIIGTCASFSACPPQSTAAPLSRERQEWICTWSFWE